MEAGTGHHCVPVPRQQVQARRRKNRRPGAQAAALESGSGLTDDGDLLVDRSTDVPPLQRDSFVRVLTQREPAMAKTVDHISMTYGQRECGAPSFAAGTGSSTLKRALAIQQNVFLHLFSTKVRSRMLSFSATWYLGTLTLGTFFIPWSRPESPDALLPSLRAASLRRYQGSAVRGLVRNVSAQFASLSAHCMVSWSLRIMFKVFYRGAYRHPREF